MGARFQTDRDFRCPVRQVACLALGQWLSDLRLTSSTALPRPMHRRNILRSFGTSLAFRRQRHILQRTWLFRKRSRPTGHASQNM